MPQPAEPSGAAKPAGAAPAAGPAAEAAGAPFIKLAMRNMVRKGRQSLVHFGLTALGLTGFLVFLAWLGRPNLPQ